MRKMLVILCVFLSVVACGAVSADDNKPKQIKAEALSNTSVTPYLQDKIIAGKNQIFCSTFQNFVMWIDNAELLLKE